MPILVTADLHLSDNPRDQYRLDFQKRLRAMVSTHNVDLVLVLGDLCEEKDRHSAYLVNQVVSAFDKLSRLCPVIILRGNHDYLSPETPFYGFLNCIPDVMWINKPLVVEKPLAKGAITAPLFEVAEDILFLPDTNNYKRDWADLDLSKFELIFTHNTFTGAHAGHGQVLEGIPLSVLKGDALTVSGDIHVPQDLGNLTYVGAPYLVDFGDSYTPRVLLIEGKKWKSIECEGPQKRLIEVSSIEELNKKKKLASPGDIIKVRVSLDPSEHAEWPAMREAVNAWGEKEGFTIQLVQPVITQEGGARKPRVSHVKKDDGKLIEEYVKRRGVDEQTKKVGLKLMESS